MREISDMRRHLNEKHEESNIIELRGQKDVNFVTSRESHAY